MDEVHCLFIFSCVISHVPRFLWTGFDLNLPLDEFGAVNFDAVQNMPGICLNSWPAFVSIIMLHDF